MSGRKNNLPAYQTVTNGDMSGNLTSKVTNIQHLDDVGYQFNFTGSPVGTIALQISADYQQDINGNVMVAGNWVPITFSYWNGSATITATSIPTTVGSPIYLDLALLSAPYIRAVYTFGSGSGTLNAFIVAKML